MAAVHVRFSHDFRHPISPNRKIGVWANLLEAYFESHRAPSSAERFHLRNNVCDVSLLMRLHVDVYAVASLGLPWYMNTASMILTSEEQACLTQACHIHCQVTLTNSKS